jgi:hypothetical protein
MGVIHATLGEHEKAVSRTPARRGGRNPRHREMVGHGN